MAADATLAKAKHHLTTRRRNSSTSNETSDGRSTPPADNPRKIFLELFTTLWGKHTTCQKPKKTIERHSQHGRVPLIWENHKEALHLLTKWGNYSLDCLKANHTTNETVTSTDIWFVPLFGQNWMMTKENNKENHIGLKNKIRCASCIQNSPSPCQLDGISFIAYSHL